MGLLGWLARIRRILSSAVATCISSKTPANAEQMAALRFARWISAPERAADWSIRSGYIATSPAAYETPALKEYIAKFPEANVARTFLPVATGELSVHENQRVYKVLTDNIQACLNGTKTPAKAWPMLRPRPTAS